MRRFLPSDELEQPLESSLRENANLALSVWHCSGSHTAADLPPVLAHASSYSIGQIMHRLLPPGERAGEHCENTMLLCCSMIRCQILHLPAYRSFYNQSLPTIPCHCVKVQSSLLLSCSSVQRMFTLCLSVLWDTLFQGSEIIYCIYLFIHVLFVYVVALCMSTYYWFSCSAANYSDRVRFMCVNST